MVEKEKNDEVKAEDDGNEEARKLKGTKNCKNYPIFVLLFRRFAQKHHIQQSSARQ
jgi:hypothetical protein